MDDRPAGQRLIEALSQDGDSYALTVVIIEAARIVDRLGKLDDLLSGDADLWLRLSEARDGEIYVAVDNALSEARQQATVLKHLLAEVHRQRAMTPTGVLNDDLAGI